VLRIFVLPLKKTRTCQNRDEFVRKIDSVLG
jgi:hypothetical protein